MLKEYQTIQKSKYASKIEPKGKLDKMDEVTYKYSNKQGAITELVEFTCKKDQVPEAGDYIVQNPDGVTYYLEDKLDWESNYRAQGFKLL
jgi:hypothetical protein